MADKNFIVKNGLTVGGSEIVNSSGALTQSLITAVPSGATATTQSTGNSSTALATTAYVRGEIDSLIDSAPGTLNTLNELAAAINDDAAFNTTLTAAIALKAPLASPSLTGASTITTTDNSDTLSLISTDADANSGPNLLLHRNSASPADNDLIGSITFDYENDPSETTTGVNMFAKVIDVTNGTEDAQFEIDLILNGTARNYMDFYPGEIGFNQDAQDIDFRVESTNNTHALFVQGSSGNVGIGTSSINANSKLEVAGRIRFEGGSTSLPALTSSDYDTGLWWTGGDVLGVSTAGSERWRWDSSGNILMQGGSPEFHFGTNSASHANWRVACQEVVSNAFEIASGTQSVGSNAMSDTYTTRFVILNTGNIGIGDNNPDTRLHVSGNVKVGTAASSSWSTNSHGAGGLDVFVGSGSDGLTVWDDNSQSAPRFTVKRAGNVGIGETSPDDMLHIKGTMAVIKLEDSAGATNAGFIDFDGSSLQLNTTRDPNTGTFVNTSRAHAGFSLHSGDGSSSIRFDTASGNNGVATKRMAIDHNGAISFGNDASAYEAWKTSYTGYNSGSPYVYFQPVTAPGSGTLTTRFVFDNANGSSTSSNNYAALNVGGQEANFAQFGIQSTGNATMEMYSASGTSTQGNCEIFFSADGSGTHQSIASIVAQQGSGDAGARKGELQFRVSDNGGPATALTIANNGFLTIAQRLYFPDNGLLLMGGGSDFKLFHDGSDNIIDGGNNHSLRIRHGGSNNWEFHSSGLFKGNDGKQIVLGSSSDFLLWHDGSDSYIRDAGTGNFLIQGSDLYFGDASNNHKARWNMSTGDLSLNSTSAGGAGSITFYRESNFTNLTNNTNSSAGNGNEFQTFRRNGAQIGSITMSGTTGTSYNESSDYRLKENVDYSWDATTRLKQLKPARFNWISDETNTLQDGFLAHEVSSIVPNAVIGDKDAMETYTDENGEEQTRMKPQQIDYGKLVPLLVKTIQELEARITILEG